MLILPAEHPLDWKKPPVMTLLLIALNVLIYFGYQGGDSAREAKAVDSYLQAGLLSRERPLFVESFSARHELSASETKQLERVRRSQMTRMVLYDLQFENSIHNNPDYLADSNWQAQRSKVEQLRDQISSMRFGFIPARFSLEGLFGAMFLHGSFSHLAGNMLFLFIFGFALEIALGRWLYLGLYLTCGVASHLLWWIMDPAWVTGVGASGAISGLMGMYLAVYGLRRINFFYWLGPLFGYFRAPALWILPVWMGKELYGLLMANDNTNYYAHLGGLGAGFLAIYLSQLGGKLRVDQDYLNKTDPDAQFKRELASLDKLIAGFELERASVRGLTLVEQYPNRPQLLEKLYALALNRQDKALLSAVLKQVFKLPDSPQSLGLFKRMVAESNGAQQHLLRHPSVQLHLLQRLLRVDQGASALGAWRLLSQAKQRPPMLPAMTLQLAKQLGRQQDLKALAEVSQFLNRVYPDAEQTMQVHIYRQHLNNQPS
ncbi:rhomboid family intramembrane serine protease [Pseudomonas sp. RL_15y_Pfl2_60]|uniref:rhomboid family intramembrane serine protease n=1 Tax=Pseudomonas sp. RL_15y_Pfl2_60 TaxID=3088709 RepID=UPI0030DDA473